MANEERLYLEIWGNWGGEGARNMLAKQWIELKWTHRANLFDENVATRGMGRGAVICSSRRRREGRRKQ